jgi:hypothetical protein
VNLAGTEHVTESTLGASWSVMFQMLGISRSSSERASARFAQMIARQPCLICGRRPSDPHHLRFAQVRAQGRKVSDEFVVPLCRCHHRALHRVGNERGWWKAAGLILSSSRANSGGSTG